MWSAVIAAASTSVSAPNDFWLYIAGTVLAGLVIAITVRIIPATRNWFRKADRVDEMLLNFDRFERAADIVLGDPEAKPPKIGLEEQIVNMALDVAAIKFQLQPNGKKGDQVADVIARVEDMLKLLVRQQGEGSDKEDGSSRVPH